ncbi:ABC transporter permease [Thalassococcus sp. CAU 1522]|uniref:ABC transporter permease n=1 Tax=Thalassococcus arenae TaxID=2851652 RepID=A0ABS6N2X9_9RHOB|nr:ABC transporter permease [Thalassococcus arenae]MBV2358372.1 ABC transporter permease [Thalassococcus arenae]
MSVAVDTPFRRFASDFVASPLAVIAAVGLVLIALMALFAGVVAPQNPYDLAQIDILDGSLEPGSEGFTGFRYWLGTDEQGRDMLSAMIYGLRISLFVSFVAVTSAVLVGMALGLLAAWRGGWIEGVIMRTVDIQLSFPALLVALLLLAALGKGVDKVIIALILVQWAYFARTVRAAALVEIKKDYVMAARAAALPEWRILFGHVLPNVMPPVLVIATVQVANAIAIEASLSFLGVGVPITEPSLGLLIANGFDYLLSGRYWISFYPGVALLVTLVCINMVGDHVRDILNPRMQR